MADTLAVTNAGVLQQYDSPERVFTHPMNTFVAGVVDSRAMNLMNVKIVVPLTAPRCWEWRMAVATVAG